MKDLMEGTIYRDTRIAFLWTRVLTLPFWGVFLLLPMILCKELKASTLEITTAIALKPIASLLSPYWSSRIYERQDRLVSNIFWANILKYLPFLFFPWVSGSWFVLLSIGLFWALKRGVIPAWMEALKIHAPKQKRNKLFAAGSTIDYVGSIFMPFIFGWLLDSYVGCWRWIFFGTGLLGILSSWLVYRMPRVDMGVPIVDKKRLYKHVMEPWQRSWSLLKQRPDFLRFQLGFMLGGAGLMLIQPALQKYFVDILNLSYTQMLMAVAAFKGIGFATTSPLWARFLNKSSMFRMCMFVTLAAGLFPLLLMGAPWHLSFLFVAYLIYGVMQAGSELSWHMSGPIFSNHTDSSPYSATNVLAVGTRGVIFPYLGGLLYAMSNATVVMICGALVCLAATFCFRKWERSQEKVIA